MPSRSVPPRLPSAAVAFAWVALSSLRASGQEVEVASDPSADTSIGGEVGANDDVLGRSRKRGFAALNRPAGMAEFGVGWLSLPAAEVCVEPDRCERGDTTPQVDAWQFFRLNVDFAVGAGITLGLLPTRDSPPVDPPGVRRSHTRQYFMFETMARYYPYVGETSEAWVGLATGLTVVKDAYVTDTDETYATVGTPGVTVQTEGFTVGLGLGAAFALAPSWSLGGALRFGSWFLPSEAKRGPFDSDDPEAIGATRATLTGRNSVVSLGFSIAYRSSL
ncbi:MAG TPA: hypothetical protein VFU02_21755 [Polyangiaceae bacterium]|nr:hypothetical protein [Polyangiaceae bacterium]